MQKTFKSRLLTVLLVLTVLVCAIGVTVMAESVKYDYTGMSTAALFNYDANNHDAGGWQLHWPTGTTGMSASAGTAPTLGVGIQDGSTRQLGRADDRIWMKYNIPTASQVKIKNYGEIEFHRFMSNGDALCNVYGTEYAIVLIMDDGQELAIEFPWFDEWKSIGAAQKVITENIEKEIATLTGDPTLVAIKYIPYVDGDYFNVTNGMLYKPATPEIPDDPETEENEYKAAYAGQTGSYFYFLTKYFQLNETAAAPVLTGVEDTWDGETVTERNGKITGFDAAKTYYYAPAHSLDADFVKVEGVEELTGLVGGVYEVYATEEGKSNSDKVIVVVPKKVNGSFNQVNSFLHRVDTDGAPYAQNSTPVSGKWATIQSGKVPYGSSDIKGTDPQLYRYLTLNASPLPMVGQHADSYALTYRAAHTAKGAEAYRHEYVTLTYAFTPEEQFDVDEVAFNSLQLINNYIWSSNPGHNVANGDTTFALLVYVNGDLENPALYEYAWTASGAVQSVKVNASAELDGYVTAIKYIHYYNCPDETPLVTTSFYPQYAGLSTYELKANTTFAPIGAAESDTTVKITNLNAANTYKLFDGEKYTTYTGVTEIKGLEFGTYTIQEFSADFAPSEIVEFAMNGVAEFDEELEVALNTVTGFVEGKTYEYAPVTILGTGEWKSVPAAATEIELANGLYVFRVKGENGYFSSVEKYVYCYDKVAVRDVLWTIGADGKKTVLPSATQGNNTRPYDVGYWTNTLTKNFGLPPSGYMSADFAGVYVYNNFYIDTTDDAAFPKLLALDTIYSMKPEEIVPVSELVNIKVSYNYAGNIGSSVLEGYNYTHYTSRIRVHVAGSDVPYYDIEHKTGDLIDFKKALPADAHGYVTALQFFPIAFIPEGAHVQDAYKPDGTTEWGSGGRYIYVFMYLYQYNVRKTAQIGDFATEGYLDGFRITGLEATKNYAYSTDKVTWIPVPNASKAIYVEEAGTYYIKVLGDDVTTESVVKTVVVGETQPAVTGLKLVDGKITGLEADKAYQYGKLNVNEMVWTDITGVTEIDATAGVYAVRLAGNATVGAGAPAYVAVVGEKYGTIAWGNPADSANTGAFVQGVWTANNGGRIYNDATIDSALYGTGSKLYGIRYGMSARQTYETRRNQVYKYALMDEEVFPVANLGALKVHFGFGAGKYWTNASSLTGMLRVHVAGGTQDTYEIFTDYNNGSWDLAIFDPSTVIPAGTEGYVTALEFYPWYEVNGDHTDAGATKYPVFRLWYYDTDPETQFVSTGNKDSDEEKALKDEVNLQTTKWRNKLWAVAAPILTLEKLDSDEYVSGYKITGLDSTKVYNFIINGVTVDVTEVTEYICTTPGTYQICVAATETEEASAFVTIKVPFTNPVFGKTAQYNYTKLQVAGVADFVAGKWTTAVNAYWANGGGNGEVVSLINKDVVLNTVGYRYEFTEDEYVDVNDNPWFSMDIRNQVFKFGTDNIVPDAIWVLDIYTTDSETPYTISREWLSGGYSLINGYTKNAVNVNLLDMFPELEGKTIKAFEIKPYSNIDKTPNDFNVTADANRYIYFHLLYLGFFDTPANTAAVAYPATGKRVNTLTGLEAECNTIFAIGATPTASELKVYET